MNLEKLNKKLVDTVEYLSAREEDKKAFNKSICDEIKGARKRINCLSKAIKTGRYDALSDVFDIIEIEDLSK